MPVHCITRCPRPMVAAVAVAAAIFCAASEAEANERCPASENRVVVRIQQYCTKCWRNANIPASEWADCTQQVFAEYLQRAPRKRIGQAIFRQGSPERRELNRSVWRIIQRWIRARRHVSLGDSDCPDPTTIGPSPNTVGDLETVLRIAADRLTPRQNRILLLLCEGFSVGEISQQLGVSPARVSDEKYRALQKIRRHIIDHAV